MTEATGLHKVVWHDGYDRETIAERLEAENLTHDEACALCEKLRSESRYEGDWWFVRKQDEALWRGMEELV